MSLHTLTFLYLNIKFQTIAARLTDRGKFAMKFGASFLGCFSAKF
ncbi:hypothetical protein [uncultured Campylobacter sp.]|nr:hypothetical protein [uncultured Campylobacter sp.]